MILLIAAVFTVLAVSARKDTHDLRQKAVRMIGTPTDDVTVGLMPLGIRQLKSV